MLYKNIALHIVRQYFYKVTRLADYARRAVLLVTCHLSLIICYLSLTQ